MHKPAVSFSLQLFLVGTCWKELSHWKTPFLEWGGLLCHSSSGAVRTGRVSLLWLVSQGGYQFFQEIYSILEGRLLRANLVLQVSIKPLGRVLWSYCCGCCCCCSSLTRCVMNVDMGTQQSRGPWLDEASECAGWKDRSYFGTCFSGRTGEVHMVCGSLLQQGSQVPHPVSFPCLISNSSQTLSVWDDEERM